MEIKVVPWERELSEFQLREFLGRKLRKVIGN